MPERPFAFPVGAIEASHTVAKTEPHVPHSPAGFLEWGGLSRAELPVVAGAIGIQCMGQEDTDTKQGEQCCN
jgi:hypothetical protein